MKYNFKLSENEDYFFCIKTKYLMMDIYIFG